MTHCYNMVGAWPDTEVARIGGASSDGGVRGEHEGDECVISISKKKLWLSHSRRGAITFYATGINRQDHRQGYKYLPG